MPARDGVHEAVLEQNDAVGEVLEEPVTRRVRDVDLLGLRGDDSREAALVKPLVQPEEFEALHPGIVELREEHVDAVEHDAARAQLPRLGGKAREKAREVECSSLNGRAVETGVEEEEPFLLKPGKVPAEPAGVLDDLARTFLEGDEDAWLARPPRPLDENLERQDRLPAAGSADDERRSPAGQAAVGQRVETRHERWKTVRSFPYPKVRRFLGGARSGVNGLSASSSAGPSELGGALRTEIEVTISLRCRPAAAWRSTGPPWESKTSRPRGKRPS